MSILSLEQEYSIGVYKKKNFALTHGEGVWLFDEDGNKYLDLAGGHGIANIGHGRKEVADAVAKQLTELPIGHASYPIKARAQLLEKLAEIVPVSNPQFFFCNSGAEAVEAALKFARLATGRTQILAAKRGFHGRTFGALSATWRPEFRKPFEPLVPDFDFFSFNKTEDLAEKISEKTAAVILEIAQGEGGVYVGEKQFFDEVQKLCEKNGALLIIDEVQTGFGRTGKMFACEHFNIKPDILCLAKAMAGGYPMGAVVVREDLFASLDNIRGMHASTFGGNPGACAAALATINILEKEKLSENAAKIGAYFIAELNKIKSPKIQEVRGLGLMIGVELTDKSDSVIEALQNAKIFALPAGKKVLRFLPPLVITKNEVDLVVEELKEILI